MFLFILKRLSQGFLITWGIISLLYVIFYVIDDPVNYMVGEQAKEEEKAAIRIKYGLDKPLYVQYLHYLHKLSPIGVDEKGDFGFKKPDMGLSYQGEQPVAKLVMNHFAGSGILAMLALLFSASIGIFLGVISALKKDTFWDRSIVFTSLLGVSAPSFFVAVFIIWIFAVMLKDYTGLNVTGYIFEKNVMTGEDYLAWKNCILPTFALGIRPLAVFVQLTRSSMVDVLQADYIRTAYAKGLSPWVVISKHALRNALNPVLTSVTGWLASLLAGAFFVEYIFHWKGIGKLTIDSLTNHDFPIILGCCIFIGLIFVIVNILTDIMYAILDPRVKIS
jgi:peptide/nickel transport system permease protein